MTKVTKGVIVLKSTQVNCGCFPGCHSRGEKKVGVAERMEGEEMK